MTKIINKPMFLDDELLQMCKEMKDYSTEAIQQLNKDICKRCEQYYKSKITDSTPPSDVKSIIDRTFNLFDSFVRMAKDSDYVSLNILGVMFDKNSFRSQTMANDEFRKSYDGLSRYVNKNK
jgi:hypothetical protein